MASAVARSRRSKADSARRVTAALRGSCAWRAPPVPRRAHAVAFASACRTTARSTSSASASGRCCMPTGRTATRSTTTFSSSPSSSRTGRPTRTWVSAVPRDALLRQPDVAIAVDHPRRGLRHPAPSASPRLPRCCRGCDSSCAARPAPSGCPSRCRCSRGTSSTFSPRRPRPSSCASAPSLALTGGMVFNHISNGGTAAINPGMNSRMLEFGVVRR